MKREEKRISPRHGLVTDQHVTAADRAAVEQLKLLCDQYEGLDLPVHIEETAGQSGEEIQWLRYYHDGTLIGFCNIDDFEEVYGMVHPDHHRQGIGSSLLAAALEICRPHHPSILLASEAASLSGKAFAAARGGRYTSSEYRLILAATPQPQSWAEPIELRPVTHGDLDLFVHIASSAFGDSEEFYSRRLSQETQRSDRRYYLGYLEGVPIGCLRLHQSDTDVSITTFGVLPTYQGRGYGQQILTNIVHQLQKESWQHIIIEVATDNNRALSLYQRCGFHVTAEYQYYSIAL